MPVTQPEDLVTFGALVLLIVALRVGMWLRDR